MKEPLNRADSPPPKGPKNWIRRVRGGQALHCGILSPAVWGVFTHWDGKRTRECFADVKKCDRCRDGLPNRWRGYLYVWLQQFQAYEFLEITGDAYREIVRQQGERPNLRGMVLEIKRHGAGHKGKLIVSLKEGSSDPDSLPTALDPEETLRALWSWMSF